MEQVADVQDDAFQGVGTQLQHRPDVRGAQRPRVHPAGLARLGHRGPGPGHLTTQRPGLGQPRLGPRPGDRLGRHRLGHPGQQVRGAARRPPDHPPGPP
ncbi:hypothetical protein SDC9_125695 [bioreactor metagenome]|uniref:Uncharacterized protein n=1 Tax=bioreactor metagenome TaxID=1076179 RepID=A0A645CP87_9ZZZZ